MSEGLDWVNAPKYEEILDNTLFVYSAKKILYRDEIARTKTERKFVYVGLFIIGILLADISLMHICEILWNINERVGFVITTDFINAIVGIVAGIIIAIASLRVGDSIPCSETDVMARHRADSFEDVRSSMMAHSKEIRVLADKMCQPRKLTAPTAPKNAEERLVAAVLR